MEKVNIYSLIKNRDVSFKRYISIFIADSRLLATSFIMQGSRAAHRQQLLNRSRRLHWDP